MHMPEATTAGSRSASPVTPPSSEPAKAKRRKNTAPDATPCCLNCRKRKVKCGGPPKDGPCDHCQRLGYTDCSFVTNEVNASQGPEKIARSVPTRTHTEAGTPRKRTQKACSECHAHKTKCSGDEPICKRCRVGGYHCEYATTKRKFSSLAIETGANGETSGKASTAPPGTVGALSQDEPAKNLSLKDFWRRYFIEEPLQLRKDILVRHINAYFNYVQDVPGMGLFRTSKFLRQLARDEVSGVDAAAICAVTALILSPDENGRNFARLCKNRVDADIFAYRGTIARHHVLPLALCCTYDWITGQYARSYRDRSDGADLIKLLNLNWDDKKSKDFQEQEGVRRVVWFFYIFDRWVSGGFDYLLKLRDEDMDLRLPCNEIAFQEGQPVEMERLSDAPRNLKYPSMHAFFIRLMRLRHRILDKTKALTDLAHHPNRSKVRPSEIMDNIEQLRKQLVNLNAALPDSLKDTDGNIERHWKKPAWTSFIMFHTWLYCLYTDLHRFALPDLREKASVVVMNGLTEQFISSCQRQAVGYSISMARLWQTLRYRQRSHSNQTAGVDGMIVTDWMAPVCLIQIIRILLVTRKYGLWRGVAEVTTAPLRHSNKPIDGAEVQELLECTLECGEDFLDMKPDLASMFKDLRNSVESKIVHVEYLNDKAMQTVDDKEAVANLKLPGPLAVLEIAMTKKEEEEPEVGRLPPLHQSGAGIGFGQSPGHAPSQASNSPAHTPSGSTTESVGPSAPAFLRLARDQPTDVPDLFQIVQPDYAQFQGMDMFPPQLPMAVDPEVPAMPAIDVSTQSYAESFPNLQVHAPQAFQMPPRPPPPHLPFQWQAIHDAQFAHAQLVPLTYTEFPELPTRQGGGYQMQILPD